MIGLILHDWSHPALVSNLSWYWAYVVFDVDNSKHAGHHGEVFHFSVQICPESHNNLHAIQVKTKECFASEQTSG